MSASDPFETPEEMLFGANLDEFAKKVGYICALESNNKISSAEAYRRIKALWKSLKRTKKNLHIGEEEEPNDTSGGSSGS